MGVEQLPGRIGTVDAIQQLIKLLGVIAPALTHLAHLNIGGVQHRQHMQTCHQLHPTILMAAIGNGQAIAIAT